MKKQIIALLLAAALLLGVAIAGEDAPKLTLITQDGTRIEGTGNTRVVIHYRDASFGMNLFDWGGYRHDDFGYLSVNISDDQVEWAQSQDGPAILEVDGHAFAGKVNCWAPTSWVISFHPEGGDSSPAGYAIREALLRMKHIDGPDSSDLFAETKCGAFSDVLADAWYAPYVTFCAQQELLNGTGNGKFSPDTFVNNDEAMVMAARALWQSDGGEGALPAGLTPEALVELLGEGQQQLAWPALDDAKRLSELWPYDGFCYLVRRCPELEFELPDYLFNTYTATRQTFFRLLALAGRDLPEINDVATVPGCRDEAVLHLYRAGVLSGTDGYGSFQGQRHLTRAEAAAALARLTDPALRLKFEPEPAPWVGYTLTELAEDDEDLGVCYPVLLLGKNILTLDGQVVDYPPGRLIGGTSIDAKGEYCQLFLTAEDYPDDTGHCAVLIDAAGNFPFPAWSGHDYYYLSPLSGGDFLAMTYDDNGAERWYVLSADGTVEKALVQLPAGRGWYEYNEGLCPLWDEDSGLVGYVNSEGQWVLSPQWTRAESFSHDRAIVWTGNAPGVIDATGKLLFSVAAGRELTAGYLSPDCDAPMRYSWNDWTGGDCGWLDADGNAVPGPGVDPERGDLPTYQNGYYSDGQTYYDLSGQPCSETFDWCGPLNADGRGFVGLSGGVYRIEFTP